MFMCSCIDVLMYSCVHVLVYWCSDVFVLLIIIIVYCLSCRFCGLVCFGGSSPKLMSDQPRATPQKRKGSKAGRGGGNRRAAAGEDDAGGSDDPKTEDDDDDDDDVA